MPRNLIGLILLITSGGLVTACAPQPAAEGLSVSVTRVEAVAPLAAASSIAATAAPTATQVPGWQQADLLSFAGQSVFDGVERRVVMPYYFFSPREIEQGQLYPLIIMLHGAGVNANDVMRLARPQLPEPLAQNPESRATFRASPLAPEGVLWWEIPDAVAQLAEELVAIHPIDPERVYLMGFSNGGGGVLSVAAYYPEPFAAFVPIAGFWPYQGRNERDRALICPAADRGFYFYHGDSDEIIAWTESERMVAYLRDECGAQTVVWELVPMLDHVGALSGANQSPEVYDWLFAQGEPD